METLSPFVICTYIHTYIQSSGSQSFSIHHFQKLHPSYYIFCNTIIIHRYEKNPYRIPRMSNSDISHNAAKVRWQYRNMAFASTIWKSRISREPIVAHANLSRIWEFECQIFCIRDFRVDLHGRYRHVCSPVAICMWFEGFWTLTDLTRANAQLCRFVYLSVYEWRSKMAAESEHRMYTFIR